MSENRQIAITLLADAGGTGISWAVLQGAKSAINKNKTNTGYHKFNTEGFHPYHNTDDKLITILQKNVSPELKGKQPQKIVYYGTGCSNVQMSSRVENIFRSIFQQSEILVYHDMLAAARATCGRKPGMACILGTGSNSCLYDGEKIVQQQISLGYILGDEGSGAHLGKRLLTEMLYKMHSEEMIGKFYAYSEKKYGNQDLLSLLYQTGDPSRYLASFVPFIAEHMNDPAIRKIAETCFNEFFKRHISLYNAKQDLPIHFSGGLSIAFKDIITDICQKRGLKTGVFLDNPLDALIAYHTGEN